MQPKIANKMDVVTKDGKRLFGMDAELYLKQESKRDRKFELEVAEWIEEVTGAQLKDKNDLGVSLKDGVILCALVNKIKPGTIKSYNTTRLMPLMERDNIQLYLKACWTLGVSEGNFFMVGDLHDQKSMNQVVQNIVALSRIAPNLGFKGRVIGPQEGEGYQGTKYSVNTESKYVHTDDYYDKDSPQRIIEELKLELAEEKQQNQQYKSQKINFDEEMRNLKDKFTMEKDKILKETEELKQEIERVSKGSNKNTPVKKLEDKPQVSEIEKHYKQEVADLENQIKEVDRKYKELREKNSELVKKHKEALEQLNQRQKEFEEQRKLEMEQKKKEMELQKQQQENSQKEEIIQPKVEQKQEELVVMKEGKNEFFFHKKSSERVQHLQERITRLLYNKEIDFEEVVEFQDFLKTDAGRRVFTFILKSTMKKVPSLILSDNSWELVLYLFNASLKQEYFNLNDPVNFITASVLLKASKVIGRKTKEGFEYIQYFIKHHPVWLNLDFWEEHFWNRISKNFKNKFKSFIVTSAKDGFNSKESNFVATFISEYLAEVCNYGIDNVNIEKLLDTFLHRLYGDQKSIQTQKENITKLIKKLVK